MRDEMMFPNGVNLISKDRVTKAALMVYWGMVNLVNWSELRNKKEEWVKIKVLDYKKLYGFKTYPAAYRNFYRGVEALSNIKLEYQLTDEETNEKIPYKLPVIYTYLEYQRKEKEPGYVYVRYPSEVIEYMNRLTSNAEGTGGYSRLRNAKLKEIFETNSVATTNTYKYILSRFINTKAISEEVTNEMMRTILQSTEKTTVSFVRYKFVNALKEIQENQKLLNWELRWEKVEKDITDSWYKSTLIPEEHFNKGSIIIKCRMVENSVKTSEEKRPPIQEKSTKKKKPQANPSQMVFSQVVTTSAAEEPEEKHYFVVNKVKHPVFKESYRRAKVYDMKISAKKAFRNFYSDLPQEAKKLCLSHLNKENPMEIKTGIESMLGKFKEEAYQEIQKAWDEDVIEGVDTYLQNGYDKALLCEVIWEIINEKSWAWTEETVKAFIE